MAKNTGLSDKEIKKIKEVLKGKKAPKGDSSTAMERSLKAQREGGYGAGIKEWFKTGQLERQAAGKKTNRAAIFRGLGMDNVASIVETLFEKSATEEEQAAAKKELGLDKKEKKVSGSGFSMSTSKQLLSRFKVVSENIAVIRKDVEFIKDRLSPKQFDAKKEGGKDNEKQRVQFDPLAPHGEQFRQVNEMGQVTTLKVGTGHLKSATMKAAMLGKPTAPKAAKATGKVAATKAPKAAKASGKMAKVKIPKAGKTTGKLSMIGAATKMTAAPKMPKAAPAAPKKFEDPAEASPFDDDIAKGLEKDPMTGVMTMLTSMDKKLDKILKQGGPGGSMFDDLMFISNFAKIAGPILSTVGGVLGPMAAVGAAAFIGYQVGSWLEKEFKLGDKVASAVDTVAGFFGGGTKAKQEKESSKQIEKLADFRNKSLEGTGWKYVAPAKPGEAGSLLDPNGKKVAVKEAPDDIKQKLGYGSKPPAGDKATAAPSTTAAPAASATPSAQPSAPSAPPSPSSPPSAPSAPPSASAPMTSAATEPSGPSMPAPSGGDKETMDMIKANEGYRLEPYKDSLGLWTVGVGHLIGNGKTLPDEWNRRFTPEEVDSLFAKDYSEHKDAAEDIPGFNNLDKKGQGALTDMTFNMGKVWWKKWPTFTKFMKNKDVTNAANSLQDSKWYTQVKGRAVRNVALIKNSATSTPASTTPTESVDKSAMVASTMAAPAASTAAPAPTAPAASAAAPTPAVASTGTATPAQTTNGAAIDAGTREMDAGKAAAMAAPAPVVVAASSSSPAAPSKLPSNPLPKALVRAAESTFARALAKDYSHPTAFTTVGTI